MVMPRFGGYPGDSWRVLCIVPKASAVVYIIIHLHVQCSYLGNEDTIFLCFKETAILSIRNYRTQICCASITEVTTQPDRESPEKKVLGKGAAPKTTPILWVKT